MTGRWAESAATVAALVGLLGKQVEHGRSVAGGVNQRGAVFAAFDRGLWRLESAVPRMTITASALELIAFESQSTIVVARQSTSNGATYTSVLDIERSVVQGRQSWQPLIVRL